jgi:adenylyltransferase/sulfurtransferase
MRFRELRVRNNPECPVCGANPTVKELIDYNQLRTPRVPSRRRIPARQH